MKNILVFVSAILTCGMAGALTVAVDSVKQRYPWNGLVDLDYTVTYTEGETELDAAAQRLEAVASDLAVSSVASVRMGTFDSLPLPLSAGSHRATWNAKMDGITNLSDNVRVQLALVQTCTAPKYMVIDLSGGPLSARYPVTYLEAEPAGGFNTDEYKTTKMAFRVVPPGSFIMGSSVSEPGRMIDAEWQHPAVLTKPYYLALFELTMGQYRRITGQCSGYHYGMDERQPLNNVSMNTFRGTAATTPVALTPLATLRAKTGLAIDLPTEAQWEFACRAGTTTPFSDGVVCTSTADVTERMKLLGRYSGNVNDPQGTFTTKLGNYAAHTAMVGSYPPNPWGFYDMHGNVWEAVRDLWANKPGAGASAVDPCYRGADLSPVAKGGSFAGDAARCRSAARTNLNTASGYSYAGFRLALTLGE